MVLEVSPASVRYMLMDYLMDHLCLLQGQGQMFLLAQRKENISSKCRSGSRLLHTLCLRKAEESRNMEPKRSQTEKEFFVLGVIVGTQGWRMHKKKARSRFCR